MSSGRIDWSRPDDIRVTTALPKTRSGKIMRRLLKEPQTAAGKSAPVAK